MSVVGALPELKTIPEVGAPTQVASGADSALWTGPGRPALPGSRPEATGCLDVTIPTRLEGPPGMGNGGWVAGTVASFLRPGPVEVTLRAPTPLGVPLHCEWAADVARLHAPGTGDGAGAVLVEARTIASSPVPPPFVGVGAAARGQARFAGHRWHPFPGCFVCGVDRATGDGMRIHPGPVDGTPGIVAGLWTVSEELAGPDGQVPDAAIWGSLDCPTAWAHLTGGSVGAAVLGRITVIIVGTVRPGATYVVVAQVQGRDRRKAFSGAGLYDVDGGLIASSRATWIELASR